MIKFESNVDAVILLKLKGKISKSRLQSVLDLLKSMRIEVEVNDSKEAEPSPKTKKLTLHSGLWKGRDLNANDLRDMVWKSE